MSTLPIRIYYTFTDEDLHDIYRIHEMKAPFGPTYAYRYWALDGDYDTPLTEDDDVEGFICAFYSEYNERIRFNTF